MKRRKKHLYLIEIKKGKTWLSVFEYKKREDPNFSDRAFLTYPTYEAAFKAVYSYTYAFQHFNPKLRIVAYKMDQILRTPLAILPPKGSL